MHKNERFIKTIFKEPVDCTPVWVMRQAGRYLPEYRKTREQAGSFMTLCKTPELACEVTLQPLRRFDLDASIIFSDILTIPDAMGLGLHFIEGEGPQFTHPLQSEKDILKLEVPDLSELSYVYEAIALVTKELAGRIPLIGFCGSPWTLASYMIEGKSVPGFPTAMKLLTQDPALMHRLLSVLAESVTLHLNAQIKAGAEAVMLFDTWGGLLSTPHYQAFSLAYLKQIIDGLHRNFQGKRIPVILFTKGGGKWLKQIADTGCDMIGCDWEISLREARQSVGEQVALQGNMHPAMLLSSENDIREDVKRILTAYGAGSGHVFNLGHGITPDVPPEHVQVLVDAVHSLSVPFHQ